MRKLVIPVAVLLAFLAGACGGTTKTKEKASIPVYTITASEPTKGKFSFNVPSTMKGGVITLELKNDGEATHDLQLAKVAAGHTLDELAAPVASDEGRLESWMEFVGGVGTTAPGESNSVTLNLPPGDYWYVCTESSDIDGKDVAHATNGMSGQLTLTGESGAELPAAAATMVATDYSFTTNGFKAGTNTMSFRNAGQQFHHAIIVPMASGATLDDVKEALMSDELQGPPPIDFEKAMVSPVINPGQVVVLDVELQSGTNYAVLCFMPDKGTAEPPHVAKGMIVQLSIA